MLAICHEADAASFVLLPEFGLFFVALFLYMYILALPSMY